MAVYILVADVISVTCIATSVSKHGKCHVNCRTTIHILVTDVVSFTPV
jgi:hypothetical protein